MVGSAIAGYRIEALLGRGRTSTCYLARRDGGPRVALRLLHPEIVADDARRERLVLQARAALRLSHPAFARVLEVVATPAHTALVVELIEGEPLADRLLRGTPGADEALEIAAEVAEAMAEAHRREVPHGPVDPARVVIDEGGRIRILGLGAPMDEAEGGPCRHSRFCLGPLLEAIAIRLPSTATGRERGTVDRRTDPEELADHLCGLSRSAREAEGRSRFVTLGISFLATAATLILLVNALLGARWIEPPAGAGTLAVLPFRQDGPVPGRYPDGIGLGLADSVITSLSDVRCLQIRPTTAVERFAAGAVDPLAAGRALGVETILTGEVVSLAGGSEVRLRLQNVRTGESRWEETLRVDAGGDFLTLQRRVVEAVRRRVAPALLGPGAERA